MPDIERIGHWRDAPVDAIDLTAGSLRLRVLTLGARLAELWVPDAHGIPADIVLGHDRIEDWLASPAYPGAICGRHANRIANGRLVLDGRDIQLDRNEGTTHLHGGREGFDRKIWRIEEQTPASVTLSTISDDGEMGYPGRLAARCTYRISASGRVWIEMTATTDAPTVVNLVNHAYFNMAGQGSGPVLGQMLRLYADHYTPVDRNMIPTGEILALRGTPFDFAELRPIGRSMPDATGFDHNFCLSAPLAPVEGIALRPCAEAVDPASGRRMRIWTDQPGVQFYTGFHLPDMPGKAGSRIGPFAGFALETQRFPDGPNRPHFPPARLDPGQVYRHHIAFDFTPLRG